MPFASCRGVSKGLAAGRTYNREPPEWASLVMIGISATRVMTCMVMLQCEKPLCGPTACNRRCCRYTSALLNLVLPTGISVVAFVDRDLAAT
jgi:hypothetical protein